MAEANQSLRPVFHSSVQPNVNHRIHIVRPLNPQITFPHPPVMAANEINFSDVPMYESITTESLWEQHCGTLNSLLVSTESALLEARRQLWEATNTQQYYLNIIQQQRNIIHNNEIEIQTITNHNVALQNELENARGTQSLLDILINEEERREENERFIPSSTSPE